MNKYINYKPKVNELSNSALTLNSINKKYHLSVSTLVCSC